MYSTLLTSVAFKTCNFNKVVVRDYDDDDDDGDTVVRRLTLQFQSQYYNRQGLFGKRLFKESRLSSMKHFWKVNFFPFYHFQCLIESAYLLNTSVQSTLDAFPLLVHTQL